MYIGKYLLTALVYLIIQVASYKTIVSRYLPNRFSLKLPNRTLTNESSNDVAIFTSCRLSISLDVCFTLLAYG